MKVALVAAVLFALSHGASSATTLLRRRELLENDASAPSPAVAPAFNNFIPANGTSNDPYSGDPVLGAVASMAGGDFFTKAWTGENIGDDRPERGAGGCAGFRRTLKCDPSGIRSPTQDKGCEDVVQAQESGFCECGDYAQFAAVDCDHRPFTCEVMCVKYAVVTKKQAIWKGAKLTPEQARLVLDKEMWAQQTDLTAMRTLVGDMTDFFKSSQALVNSQGKQAVESVNRYLDEMKKAQAHDQAQALKEMEEYRKKLQDRPWVQIWREGKKQEAAGKAIQAKIAEILPFDPLSAHQDQESDAALHNR